MQFTKNQKIILGVAGFIVLFFLLVFARIIPGLRQSAPRVDLQFWGVGDSNSAWAASIQSYQKNYPNIYITYTQVDPASYESKLVNALAAGNGPDLFMFNNSWLPKNGDKVVPAPASVISTSTFANLFPKVATQDFVRNGQVYAMPLSIDTLALIYNRDIFAQRGVAIPPATWAQFDNVVRQARVVRNGTISTPAVSMGGTLASMPNAADILNLLFLQAGTQMTTPYVGATFASTPGRTALSFYTQFAMPTSAYYTWNDSKGSALDLFAGGKSAMFIGYASQLAQIKADSPNLNLGISAVPQFSLSSKINYPDYWGLAVSKQSQNQAQAWDFAAFVATDAATAGDYVTNTGNPPALLSLIAQYQSDPVLGPYASQALTAEDWTEPDSDAVTTIFNNMIESVLNRSATVGQALLTAQTSVNNLGGLQ